MVPGSDVIGAVNAYYLVRAGFEVMVVDHQDGLALETSFANAGQVSLDYTSPWATPGIPPKAMKWLLERHTPLVIKLTSDPSRYAQMLQMLHNCTTEHYAVNRERMVRLSEYSHNCLDELRAETDIAYGGRTLGATQLFRTQTQLDVAGKDAAVLERSGVPYEVLDRDGIVRVKPALAKVADKLIGVLRLSNDQTGDCQLPTTRLAEVARGLGAEFRFGQNTERLDFAGDCINGVLVNGGLLIADRCILALDSYSPQLFKPLGIKTLVYPLKDYSLTVPITNPEMVPTSIVLDEAYKVTITRFDQHTRAGGMTEVASFNLSSNPRHRETLEMITTDLYPEGDDISQATFWTGLRLTTPDGAPIVDATRYHNLFLSTGHGTLGWTMACGSGHCLADLMAKKRPQINTGGLDTFRCSNSPGNAKNVHPAPVH